MSSPGKWVNQVQFRCEIARNSKNRDSENDRLVRSGGLWSFLGEHWGVLGWFWCFPVMWDAFSGVWISSWTRNFYGQDLGVGIRFRRLHGAGGANHAPRAGSSIFHCESSGVHQKDCAKQQNLCSALRSFGQVLISTDCSAEVHGVFFNASGRQRVKHRKSLENSKKRKRGQELLQV